MRTHPAPSRAAHARTGPLRILAAVVLVAAAGCASERDAAPSPGAATDAASPPPVSRLLTAAPPEAHADDGQGSVLLRPDGPVVCASLGSWTIDWVAGPSGLDPGDAAVLQVSPFWGWSPPQTGRPGSPGYTTARGPAGVTLRVEEGQVPMTLLAHVADGRLGPGDTLRFVYGDTASGGPGSRSRVDMYAEEFEEFLIKTDGNGDGFFAEVPGAPVFRVTPGTPVRLALAAPAVIRPGAALGVGIHGLDAHGNRSPLPPGDVVLEASPLRAGPADPPPGEAVALGSAPVDGTGAALAEVRAPAEGLYRLRATLPAAGLRGAADLLLVDPSGTFEGIRWGDLHCHSALSDGTGSPAELYAFARDVAGLDVCAVTDHDAHGLRPLSGAPWERIRAATRAAHDPANFVTLLAYEWTSWAWGHRNVYYPGEEGEVFAFLDERSDTPAELWDRIAPYGGVTIPHHPGGGPIAVDWSVPSREERETVVEICSIHGSSEAYGVERGIYRPVRGHSVRDAFALRHRLGILASGDTHDGHPGHRSRGAPANGLAAFRIEELTREAVMEAMATRNVYGTSGARILLATDWDGHRPGEDVPRRPAGGITVRVAAPEPIESVQLIGPSGEAAVVYGGGRRATHRLDPSGLPPDASFAYVRVALADGEVAWESPWWIGGRR